MGAIQRVAGTLPLAFDPDYSPARGFLGPRWVTFGRSRVRESRTLGSVGAKAEWLSYPTISMGAVNRGKAEMKSFANAVFAAFPDFKIQLMSGFTAGNWAGAEWTMSGTHKGDLPGIPATGKSFAVRGSTICELTAGKNKRNSDYWDI